MDVFCLTKLYFLILINVVFQSVVVYANPVGSWNEDAINQIQETFQNFAWIDQETSANSSSASSCNTTCTLNIKDSDVNTFQDLIMEKEALAVFMYVTVSNGSSKGEKAKYESSISNGEIVPLSFKQKEKWAWIRNRRAKFLATLPYDFDILSLTTLTKDVYDLKLKVNSTPTGCYAKLSKICLTTQIASTIINLTGKNNLGLVCLKAENSNNSFVGNGYNCCHLNNRGTLKCNHSIRENIWVKYALALLWAVSFAFGMLSPLLLKYLPKEFKRSAKLKKASNKGLRKADSGTSFESFEAAIIGNGRLLLISKDNGLLDIARTRTQSAFCSRFSRCLFVFLMSLLPIVQTLLYVYLKESEVGITDQLLGVGSAFVTFFAPTGTYVILGVYCFCILLVSIAMAIPKTLSDLARRLSGRKDERSFLGFKKPDDLVCHSDKSGFQLMYENMIFHLNCLMMFTFWKFAFSIIMYPMYSLCHCSEVDRDRILDEESEDEHDYGLKQQSTGKKILRTLALLFIFPFWFVITLSAFFLYLLPITYVAFRIWKMLFKIEVECICCNAIPTSVKILSLPLLYILFIIFCICVEASYLLLILVISINIAFLGSVIGFTTMGVLFYVDQYISYVVVIALAVYYIAKSVHSFYIRFKRLKNMIFKECVAHDDDLRAEASIRETFSGQTMERSSSISSLSKSNKPIPVLVHYDEQNIASIPLKLFLSTQSKLLPFKKMICANILGISAIFVYLLLVFFFVMSLTEYDATDPIVQALAVFALGMVPVFLHGDPNQIKDKDKKWMEFHIQETISKYCKRFT